MKKNTEPLPELSGVTPFRKPVASTVTGTRSKPRPFPAEGPASGRCLLLVDDDAIIRDSLKNVLLSEGYRVVTAENGRKALDLLGKAPVELALLDLNMPVMNGWDTFEQLSREHPLIPVIIVTARPNQLFTAANSGVGALLEKPMDIPTLLRTIAKLLAESPEDRLARLAGKSSNFDYAAGQKSSPDVGTEAESNSQI